MEHHGAFFGIVSFIDKTFQFVDEIKNSHSEMHSKGINRLRNPFKQLVHDYDVFEDISQDILKFVIGLSARSRRRLAMKLANYCCKYQLICTTWFLIEIFQLTTNAPLYQPIWQNSLMPSNTRKLQDALNLTNPEVRATRGSYRSCIKYR
jgi:hypothetical protein